MKEFAKKIITKQVGIHGIGLQVVYIKEDLISAQNINKMSSLVRV